MIDLEGVSESKSFMKLLEAPDIANVPAKLRVLFEKVQAITSSKFNRANYRNRKTERKYL